MYFLAVYLSGIFRSVLGKLPWKRMNILTFFLLFALVNSRTRGSLRAGTISRPLGFWRSVCVTCASGFIEGRSVIQQHRNHSKEHRTLYQVRQDAHAYQQVCSVYEGMGFILNLTHSSCSLWSISTNFNDKQRASENLNQFLLVKYTFIHKEFDFSWYWL